MYANAMCMSDGWFQTQIECIFKSNVLVVCMCVCVCVCVCVSVLCVCVCVQLGRLTKSVLTSTVGFTSLTHTCTGKRARYSNVQQRTTRYSNVQQGTAAYSKVQQRTARYSTGHHRTRPHHRTSVHITLQHGTALVQWRLQQQGRWVWST